MALKKRSSDFVQRMDFQSPSASTPFLPYRACSLSIPKYGTLLLNSIRAVGQVWLFVGKLCLENSVFRPDFSQFLERGLKCLPLVVKLCMKTPGNLSFIRPGDTDLQSKLIPSGVSSTFSPSRNTAIDSRSDETICRKVQYVEVMICACIVLLVHLS